MAQSAWILKWAIASRLLMLGLNVLLHRTEADYDLSTRVESQGSDWTEGFVRWDAVYFLKLAERGSYAYEQEFAFFPGLPILMRALGSI